MHQNVRKSGVVIDSNKTESDTCPLPGKSPTFYITNQFCRVRYIERLLYRILITCDFKLTEHSNGYQLQCSAHGRSKQSAVNL